MRHVLLVEDDANDAYLTKRFLSRWSVTIQVHHVDRIEDAERFLFARDASSPEIALVLLDHQLPGGSGIELIEAFRKNEAFRSVPVVVLTGNSDGVVVQRARNAGANSCVLKPVDPEDYERTVSAIAEFWLGSNLIAPRAVVL